MSKKTKYCPVCGAELDINAIICTTCGERILGDAQAQEEEAQNETAIGNGESTKQCPFCGGEININAVKCKYCKNFIEEKGQSENNIFGTIISNLLGIFIICKIAMFLFSSFGFGSHTNSDNVSVHTQVKPDGVYGSYSGFGEYSDDVNLGDLAYDCTQKGVGISLTEQFEGFFIYEIDELKEKFPYFYEMKHANPRIEFNISNPKWEDKAFNIYSDSQFCRADISFTNIPSDTVMGYSQEQYFTLENAYCSILYKVSRQGKKYKAIVSNLYCEPSYGYR